MVEQAPSAAVQKMSQALVEAWTTRLAQKQLKGIEADVPEGPIAAAEPQDLQAGSVAQWTKLTAEEADAPNAGGQPSIDEQAVLRIERLAALSGAIRPRNLATGLPADRQNAMLDRLASDFDRRQSEDGWWWTLNSERRLSILKDLAASGLASALDQTSNLETDEAGQMLRALLKSEPFTPSGGQVELQALTWAAAVRPNLASSVTRLGEEIARTARLRSMNYLLKDGFVGRKAQVLAIQAFVGQAGDTLSAPLSILQVTGLGGLGKSTLLARALSPLLEYAFKDPSTPLIISFDFDREALVRGGEVEWSLEFARQLVLFAPEHRAGVEQKIDEFRRLRSARREFVKEEASEGLESSLRHGSEFEYTLSGLVEAIVRQRAITLVIDTFEEWQRLSFDDNWAEAPVQRVIEWMEMLRRTWHLNLRAIISGRASFNVPSFATASALPLEDLPVRDRKSMLARLGVPAEFRAKLGAIAGGNPLSLKLAARHFLALPAERREALLDDLQSELAGVEESLRQGVLYNRFLDHIENPGARALAHPGLALRRVTPELIREVLAEPCGLGQLSADTADMLFRKLAREVWLVELRGNELVHRTEIRRPMLRLMANDPQQQDRIRAVHDAAAHWYFYKASSDEERAEALYHRLALIGPDEFDGIFQDTPRRLFQLVVPSAGDFELPVRVQLLDRMGRRLSPDEAKFLPPARRIQWAAKRAAELCRSGQPERALEVWTKLAPDRRPGPWYAAAAFQLGDWKGLELAPSWASPERLEPPVKYHLLLGTALRRTSPDKSESLIGTAYRELVDRCRSRDRRSLALGGDLIDDLYCLEGAAPGRGRDLLGSVPPRAFRLTSLSATQYLRLLRLGGSAPPLERRIGHAIFAGSFRPHPQFIEHVMSRLQSGSSRTDPNWSKLGEIREILAYGALPSATILGKVADDFASIVLNDEPSSLIAEQLLMELPSDEPEWRVPLRLALVELCRSRDMLDELVWRVNDLMGPATPIDLQFDSNGRGRLLAPRSYCFAAIEYLDRSGRLPAFLERSFAMLDDRTRSVADAFLESIGTRSLRWTGIPT